MDTIKNLITDEVFSQIIALIITLIVAFVSIGVSKLIKIITKKLKVENEFTELNNIEDYIRRIVLSCVQATNQTFVDSLKKQGIFTEEKQNEAFQLTYDSVFTILNGMVSTLIGSDEPEAVKVYLTKIIEETVKMCKDSTELKPEINIASLMESDPTFTTLEPVVETYEFTVEPDNHKDDET